MTITFDMRKLEAALWRVFQNSIAQNAKRQQTICDVVYDVIQQCTGSGDTEELTCATVYDVVQQCVAGGDIEKLTEALINNYDPYVDLAVDDKRVAAMRIRRLLRMFRILYRLLMRRLAEMSRSSTGRISNRDTIYRAVLAAMPTPPTVAFTMGGAV